MSEQYTAGQALDALVAEKVMGWKRLSPRLWQDQEGHHYYIDDEHYPLQPSWRPSQNIADAWDVVARMVQARPDVEDVTVSYFAAFGPGVASGWVCVVNVTSFGREVQLPFEQEEYSETALLAICRAALEWAGRRKGCQTSQ